MSRYGDISIQYRYVGLRYVSRPNAIYRDTTLTFVIRESHCFFTEFSVFGRFKIFFWKSLFFSFLIFTIFHVRTCNTNLKNIFLLLNTCCNGPLSGLCSLLTMVMNVQQLQYRKQCLNNLVKHFVVMSYFILKNSSQINRHTIQVNN